MSAIETRKFWERRYQSAREEIDTLYDAIAAITDDYGKLVRDYSEVVDGFVQLASRPAATAAANESRRKRKAALVQRARALKARGEKIADIARRLDRTERTVYTYLED